MGNENGLIWGEKEWRKWKKMKRKSGWAFKSNRGSCRKPNHWPASQTEPNRTSQNPTDQSRTSQNQIIHTQTNSTKSVHKRAQPNPLINFSGTTKIQTISQIKLNQLTMTQPNRSNHWTKPVITKPKLNPLIIFFLTNFHLINQL